MKPFLSQLHTKLHTLVTNKAFEVLLVILIILSSLSVGLQTYDIDPSTLSILYGLDFLVTVLFTIEIAIRMGSEKKWHDYFRSGWNIFDFVIVAVSWIPVDAFEYVIVGRLLRIIRILRVVVILPELRRIIEALFSSLRSLFYVGLLLFIIFYIYGVLGTLMYADVNPFLWGDVTRAMLTLFRVMTLEGWGEVMYETLEKYPMSWFYHVSFIFLTAFTFLNLVIGVLLDALQKEYKKEE